MKDTTVIYHDDCADGFTSAWILWEEYGDSADYISAQYGDDPPAPELIEDRKVYIVDFSYSHEVLVEMNAMADELVVLDHHKTAQKNLKGLDFCEFDMNLSGAMLTWYHLYPNESPPSLVEYVQDHDLWNWELYMSSEINAYIGTKEKTFEVWRSLHEMLESESGYDAAIEIGETILKYEEQIVAKLATKAYRARIGEHIVPVVNGPSAYRSSLGNLLAEGEPFAGVWYIDPEVGAIMSLRSKDTSDVDVSEVAEYYGGGGHPNAAGFTFDPRDVDWIFPPETDG